MRSFRSGQSLIASHQRGAFVVGLCLGVHVLAEAGLLEGRRATTHWEYAPEMSRRFPGVRVEPDVLYIEDGRILTSAGAAAAFDACLHFLRRRLGATRANQVARRLVIPPHREGGQAQFIEQPVLATTGDSRLVRLLQSVRQRLGEPHSQEQSVQRIAEQAGFASEVTLRHHFRKALGLSPTRWRQRFRA